MPRWTTMSPGTSVRETRSRVVPLRPPLPRDHDLDVCDPLAGDAPELRHRSRAQRGAAPRGEHRGEPLAVPRECGVTDRVDRAVDAVEPPVLGALADRARIEPEAAQLREGHQTVLVCREPRDQPIDRRGVRRLSPVEGRFVSHPGIVVASPRTDLPAIVTNVCRNLAALRSAACRPTSTGPKC